MKKITINTKTLLNAVATANNYTSKDGEFVGDITLAGNDGQMEVKATDNTQTIVFKNIPFVSSDLTDVGFKTFSLNGKKLATVLKVVKTDEVIIELEENFITVKSGRSRAKIETTAKPQNITIEKEYGKKIDFNFSNEALNYMIHAIDQNNPKWEMNGMLLEVKDSHLSMVATDTRRLAVIKQPSSTEEMSIILPKEAVLTFNKLFSDVEIETEADEYAFSVYSPFVDYKTKLISGTFPAYQNILPKTFSKIVSLDAKQLGDLIMEASMFETDILINISSEAVSASDLSGNTEASFAGIDDLEDEIKFAVNSRYILDILSNTKSKTVKICFNNTNIPFVIQTNENTQEVIMPVALPEEDEIMEAA